MKKSARSSRRWAMNSCAGPKTNDVGYPTCHGREFDEFVTCPECGGSGRVGCGRYSGECERCGGRGEIDRCQECWEGRWDK